MLTYIDASGNLVKTVPEKIYQGSNLANTIYLVGAYPQASVVTIAFKLPQTGHYTQPYVMLNANIPTNIGLNAWSFDVPVAITEYYGKVEFQVTVYGGTKTIIVGGEPTEVPIQIKSAYGTFDVEKGVQVDASGIQAPDVYDQILYLISQIQAQINNHSIVAMGILPYSSDFEYPLNALTYYNGNLYRSLQAQNIDNSLDDTEWWEEWDLSDITDLLERVGVLETTVSGFDGRITQAEADATEAKTKANSALTKVGRIKVEDNNDGTFTFTNGENQQTTIQSGYKPDETTIQLDANNKLEAIAIKDSTSTITPSDVRSNTSAISTINSKIPAQASSSNQLADKDFVNSTVGTNTAIFRGTYNLVTDLNLGLDATEQQIAAALANEIATATNNDYCYVEVPQSVSEPTVIQAYDRYKYSDADNEWAFEFELNNSSFTAAQWAAINSGITSSKVAEIDNKVNKQVTTLTAQTDIDFQTDRFDVKFKYQSTEGGLPVVITDIAGFDENGIHHTKNGVATRPKANNNDIAYLSDIPSLNNYATKNLITPDYDNTATYSVGDVVIYNQTLYKCATAVTVAEDFDSTKWTATDVIEYVDSKGVTKEQIIQNLPPFKSTLQLSVSDTTTAYTFPIVSSTNFAVDWGDGTFEFFNTATTSLTHTFTISGTIYVQFYGEWNGIHYTNSSNNSKSLIYSVYYDMNISSLPQDAFYNCSKLEKFYSKKPITLARSCFYGCSNSKFYIDFDKLLPTGSNYYQFFYSTALPSTISIKNWQGGRFGQDCFSRTTVRYFDIDFGNTNAPEIGDSCFSTTSLKRITIKAKATNLRLGNTIFNNCNVLDCIKLYTTAQCTLGGSLGSNLPSGIVILVPYDQLSAYKTATNWTTHANQIYPIGGQYSETVTIAANAWTLNSQTNLYEATATVVCATNESRNILDWSLVDSNGNQIEDTYGLGAKTQGSMSITFTAETAPTDAINIFVQSTLTNYQE